MNGDGQDDPTGIGSQGSDSDATARFDPVAPRSAPAPRLAPASVASGRPAPGGSLEALRRRRLELAERVAGLTWDLGGLTYEMAIRDHYRLDVLARRAAELQEADAELGEVERVLASSEAGVHGQCRSCGAVHSRGAAYCWHCGVPLLSEGRPSVLPESLGQPTNSTG